MGEHCPACVTVDFVERDGRRRFEPKMVETADVLSQLLRIAFEQGQALEVRGTLKAGSEHG
jgi:hypothetical protein